MFRLYSLKFFLIITVLCYGLCTPLLATNEESELDKRTSTTHFTARAGCIKILQGGTLFLAAHSIDSYQPEIPQSYGKSALEWGTWATYAFGAKLIRDGLYDVLGAAYYHLRSNSVADQQKQILAILQTKKGRQKQVAHQLTRQLKQLKVADPEQEYKRAMTYCKLSTELIATPFIVNNYLGRMNQFLALGWNPFELSLNSFGFSHILYLSPYVNPVVMGTTFFSIINSAQELYRLTRGRPDSGDSPLRKLSRAFSNTSLSVVLNDRIREKLRAGLHLKLLTGDDYFLKLAFQSVYVLKHLSCLRVADSVSDFLTGCRQLYEERIRWFNMVDALAAQPKKKKDKYKARKTKQSPQQKPQKKQAQTQHFNRPPAKV